MSIFKPLSKNAAKTDYLMNFLLISWLLTSCATSAQQTATPDVAGLSTAAVATVYANLTEFPVSTPTPPPTPLPSAITDEFGVPMVLVPAGPFLMGRDESAGGQPYVEVTVGDYYIDTYEVTNQRYVACVHAGACEAPLYSGSYAHTSYYLDPAFEDYPFLSVDSSRATAYCAWRGAHLTTEIEWEKAARGPDGRAYPWGDQPVDGTRANTCDLNCNQGDRLDKTVDDGFMDVSPVGSFPAGASPYGAMDMVGNVHEWVLDVGVARQAYLGDTTLTTYPSETRGGSWSTTPQYISHALTANSLQYSDDVGKLDRGLRCASGQFGDTLIQGFRALRQTTTPAPTRTPAAPTPTATIPPAAISTNVYQIAFLSKLGGDVQFLKIVNDDGRGLRTLFPLQQELSLEIRQPTWSPDGKSLYFIGYHNDQEHGVNQQYLYQAEPAEPDPLKVYHEVAGLPELAYEKMALSPDGHSLALVYLPGTDDEAYLGSGKAGFPALGLFNLQTKAWKTVRIPNLKDSLASICLAPNSWSPDSRQFTFSAMTKDSFGQNPGGVVLVSSHKGGGAEGADLFVAGLDGTAKKISWVSIDSQPAQCPIWAATGKQIVFAGHATVDSFMNEGLSLVVVNPDGSQRLVIGTGLPDANGQLYRTSADGMHLLTILSQDSDGYSLWHQVATPNGLFIDSYDGEGPPWDFLSNVDMMAYPQAPDWSPDGSRIVFYCEGSNEICTINPIGVHLQNLTAGVMGGYQPAWSPDGLKIAFMAEPDGDGNAGLYIMNVDGRGLRRLVDLEAYDMLNPEAFFWSPQVVVP